VVGTNASGPPGSAISIASMVSGMVSGNALVIRRALLNTAKIRLQV
jgi:hypothetical protein